MVLCKLAELSAHSPRNHGKEIEMKYVKLSVFSVFCTMMSAVVFYIAGSMFNNPADVISYISSGKMVNMHTWVPYITEYEAVRMIAGMYIVLIPVFVIFVFFIMFSEMSIFMFPLFGVMLFSFIMINAFWPGIAIASGIIAGMFAQAVLENSNQRQSSECEQ